MAIKDLVIHYKPISYREPPQQPISILDIERSNEEFNMLQPLQDGCPRCGAFNMNAGDYICFGYCYVCFDNELKGIR